MLSPVVVEHDLRVLTDSRYGLRIRSVSRLPHPHAAGQVSDTERLGRTIYTLPSTEIRIRDHQTASGAREDRVGIAATMRFRCESCLLYTSPSPRDRQKSRMPS